MKSSIFVTCLYLGRSAQALAASLLTVVFLLPSLSAMAQSTTPSVENPQSVVPLVTYRSVFRETSLGIEEEKIDWRKANNDVGRFARGHVDILKSEEMEEKKAAVNPLAAQPATPAPSAAPVRVPNSSPVHKH